MKIQILKVILFMILSQRINSILNEINPQNNNVAPKKSACGSTEDEYVEDDLADGDVEDGAEVPLDDNDDDDDDDDEKNKPQPLVKLPFQLNNHINVLKQHIHNKLTSIFKKDNTAPKINLAEHFERIFKRVRDRSPEHKTKLKKCSKKNLSQKKLKPRELKTLRKTLI